MYRLSTCGGSDEPHARSWPRFASVLVAACIVRSLPVVWLRWRVVVLHTAAQMLLSVRRSPLQPSADRKRPA
jgi:hypothetical protein